MKIIKVLYLILLFNPVFLVSADLSEFDSVMREIRKDISYSNNELKKTKQLFQEEYESIGAPGIKKLKFSDLTIHEKIIGYPADEEAMIVSTNSARVLGAWDYTKPHIYLIEKKSGKWKVIIKHEITSMYTALFGSCRRNKINLLLCTDNAVQYFRPDDYGRKNKPYVFQIFHMGGSGSSWEILTINYDWYSKSFTKTVDSLSFPVIPNPPRD